MEEDIMRNIFVAAKSRIINFNIELLKKRLAESDYKIIKCAEYQLNNMDMPYDIPSLHAERQAIRDKINALEAELTEVDAP